MANTRTSTSKDSNGARIKEMETVDLGLKGDALEGVISILTHTLSNVQVLYVKTLNVHWNIVDPNFYGIHILLDEQYNALKEAGDQVAERIRSYGSPVIGSMSDFLAHTTLKEKKGAGIVEVAALHDLVADHEAVIRQLREDIDTCSDDYGDQGAADLLTAQLQAHQKMAWMLRASLPH